MSRLTLTKIYSHKTSLSRLGLGTLMLLRIYICVVRPKSFYLFATIHFSLQLTPCPFPSISSHLISPLIRALEPHICFICHCHSPVLFFVCVWVTRGVRGTLFVCYCTFITASPTSVSVVVFIAAFKCRAMNIDGRLNKRWTTKRVTSFFPLLLALFAPFQERSLKPQKTQRNKLSTWAPIKREKAYHTTWIKPKFRQGTRSNHCLPTMVWQFLPWLVLPGKAFKFSFVCC